ncbi:MAG: hypothetical protein FWB80_08335 [Defluviitaleaceae bacterium]|nr:hypothetical protein [Defluviitaleaceae bacterium]
MVNGVNSNYNACRFEEKKATFQKLTGREISIREDGYIPSREFGFFGEFFRVGFSSVEDISRRFVELREDLLERYEGDQDSLYKRLGELNQSFEVALRNTAFVPIPQIQHSPIMVNASAAAISQMKQSQLEHETTTEMLRQTQKNLMRRMDRFFEEFILSIQTQDFQTAFDNSMATIGDDV